MEFKIIVPLLPIGKKQFLSGQDGKMDYLGQFILQLGYKEQQLQGHKLPSDMGLEIPYFVVRHRNRIIDSILTLELLRLDPLAQHLQIERVSKLMLAHKHTVQFIHVLTPLPQEENNEEENDDEPF